MSKLQILVRKMRSLALNPCASDGTNERPQTIAAGWKNTNQNRVQEKNLRVYWIVFWLSFGRKYQHYYLFEILTCWAFFFKNVEGKVDFI